MRIGIDARRLYGRKSGVGVYLANIVRNISKIHKQNPYLFSPTKTSTVSIFSIKNLIYELIWKQFLLPFFLYREKIDVLYCPSPPIPFFAPCPVVATIHDIEDHKKKPLSIFMFYLYYISARRAAKIIVPSLNTKKDVIALLKVPTSKVVIINGAVSGKFKPISDRQVLNRLKIIYSIKHGYILTIIGSFTKRKNVHMLIKAYHKLPTNLKSRFKLVIVHIIEGPLYDFTLNVINKLKLKSNIVLTGYVPNNDLPILCGGADLFVFVSLYEGFGLPCLEAMSCGVPVIASNRASIPEVVGDAGILIDPTNVEEIFSAIYKVLTDESLRKVMIRRSLNRVGFFSWERSAKKLLHILEEVVRTDVITTFD